MVSLFDIKRLLNPAKDEDPVSDFKIIQSWAEYDENTSKAPEKRNLKYLCYELEVMNPETGDRTHFYKAIKFARVRRLPDDAKQSLAFMDMQEQILAAVHENQYNMITIIANIIKPVSLGLLFMYGVQGTSQLLEEAKRIADEDFIGLVHIMQGTFRVLRLECAKAEESEWLREKMYNMDYLTVVRGIPKANKAGENAGNKGMGSSNLNPESQGTIEEIITGMVDYEYVIEVLSTPVYVDTLMGWQRQSQKEMSDWYGQLQGQRSISMNLSIPMMYMANASQASGWSQAYTDASTVNYAQGESFSTSESQSFGEAFSNTYGETVGHTEGSSLTNSFSQGLTQTQGVSFGESFGQSSSVSQGVTVGHTDGTSYNLGESFNQGVSVGQASSMNEGMSSGLASSQTVGQNLNLGSNESTGLSQGQSLNYTEGQSTGSNMSLNYGQNSSLSHTAGVNESVGYNQSESVNLSNSATVGQSASQTQSIGQSSTATYGQSQSLSQSASYNQGTSENHGSSSSGTTSSSSSTTTGWNANAGLEIVGGGINHSGTDTDQTSVSSGINDSYGSSSGYSEGYGYSQGANYSVSNGVTAGASTTVGNSTSQSATVGTGQTYGMSNSYGASESYGATNGESLSQGWGVNESSSQSLSTGENVSLSNSVGNSISAGQSESQGLTQNVGQTSGLSYSANNGQSESNGLSQSLGATQSDSYSQSASATQGTSYSQNYSQSYSESVSQTLGQSVGQTVSDSASQSASTGYTQNVSNGQSVSNGSSYTTSNGKSSGTSSGTTGTTSIGTSSSMGLNPSIGYSKSYMWMDQGVKDLLELMEYQNERIKKALRGQGAFYTYVYIACPSRDALSAAQALAKSTWQNEFAMVQPLQVINLTETEQKHLLYHFAAFSADITKEDVYGVNEYKYCTVLLPEEFVAYTHLPRLNEGGIMAVAQNIPKFAVPSMLEGEIYMGTILSPERYSFENGYNTPFDYRIDESCLMHGFFTGASRSGKTVAAMRFIAELAQIRRKKTGKRLRIIAMDPKQDWRTLARFVEPERFRFYSLSKPNFHPVQINPWKVPRGVNPQIWIDGVINIYCRAYGLLERGKQMIAEVVYGLYEDEHVFDVADDPDMVDEVQRRSGNVTFTAIYKDMVAKRDELVGSGKSGNDTKDAYARLIERLSCFGREYSIESRLYGTADGKAIDELIGKDDVTVFESKGLESTFRNFVFGVICSGFYKWALANEGGYLADDQFETVLVVEEANEVFCGSDVAGTGGGKNYGMTGESEFEEMIDQAAGYGLFVFSITQKVSNLPSSVIANTGIVFAGKISDEEDVKTVVRKVAREERIDDRDLVKWFPRSPIGWFVCQTSRTNSFEEMEPILVKIAMLNVNPPTNQELDEILLRKRAMEEMGQSSKKTA